MATAVGRTYDRTVTLWRTTQNVVVRDALGTLLFMVPLAFFTTEISSVQPWARVSYLIFIVRELTFEHAPRLELNGTVQLENDIIVEGVYRLAAQASATSECIGRWGSSLITTESTLPAIIHRPGPFGKTLRRPFEEPAASEGTVSHSSRSSEQQTGMKMHLLQRDRDCILTGEQEIRQLIGAHIIPFSYGQEFLDEFTGLGHFGLYDARNGLLLSYDAHKTFDNLQWSIFEQDNRSFIHCFGRAYREYHGKEVIFADDHNNRPDARFLKFHYRQCVMSGFRGFFVAGGDWRQWLPDYGIG